VRLSSLDTVVSNGPIVPTPELYTIMENWWSDDWQGKTCPSVTLAIINLTLIALALNPDPHGVRQATNRICFCGFPLGRLRTMDHYVLLVFILAGVNHMLPGQRLL